MITCPCSSRKCSGLKALGSFHFVGSMLALYKLRMTYKTQQNGNIATDSSNRPTPMFGRAIQSISDPDTTRVWVNPRITMPILRRCLRRGVSTLFNFCLGHRVIYHVIHRWKGLPKLNLNDPLGLLHGLSGSRNSRLLTPDRNFYLNTYLSS